MYLLAMTFGGLADRIILHPSRDPIADPSIRRIEVPAAASPGTPIIEVWSTRTSACRNLEPRGFVLAFIGNADRAEYAVDRTAVQWDDKPVEVWAVNYPGFGGSGGSASMSGAAGSGLLAYDALRKVAVDRPIFISGLSFGTAVGLHVAAERPVAGLVLHNPPPLRQLILGRFGWWNLWLIAAPAARRIPPELDSITNASRTNAPAIFILAENDEVVPPAYHRRVVEAYSGPQQIIILPGATHNDMPTGAAAEEVRAGIDGLWKQ